MINDMIENSFVFKQIDVPYLFYSSFESWWFIKNTLNHVHLISNAKLQCLTHWSFLFSNYSPFSRCLFNYLDKIYWWITFNQLKYHLSPLYRAYDFFHSIFYAFHYHSLDSNHNHKFNFYSPRSYFSWLFILRLTQYPTTYLRERLPLSDWYSSLEEARVPQAGTIGRARETRVPASRCTWIALILRAAAPCTSTNLRVRFVIDESDKAGGRERGRGWSSKRVAFSPPWWAKSVQATRWTKRVPAFNVSPDVRKISQETLFRPPIDLQKLPPRWSSVKGSVSLEIERVFVQERRVDRGVVLFLLPSLHSATLIDYPRVRTRLLNGSFTPAAVYWSISVLLFHLTWIVILYYALFRHSLFLYLLYIFGT